MEKLTDFMTKDPVCCTPEHSLQEVAHMMIQYDCGEIPVVDSLQELRIAGVITDRDICCRTVGKGLNPLEMKAEEVMTFPAITANADMSLDKCVELMEQNQIRRIPVVDDYLKVIGIVSLADLARKKVPVITELLKDVSGPKSSSLQ